MNIEINKKEGSTRGTGKVIVLNYPLKRQYDFIEDVFSQSTSFMKCKNEKGELSTVEIAKEKGLKFFVLLKIKRGKKIYTHQIKSKKEIKQAVELIYDPLFPY